MSNTQKRKEVIKILFQYKSVLEKDNFPVKALILYGSYARGDFKSYSDIDVCVISEKFLRNKDKMESYLWKKVLEVDPRIEPVGYHPKDFINCDPLVYEIQRNGIKVRKGMELYKKKIA